MHYHNTKENNFLSLLIKSMSFLLCVYRCVSCGEVYLKSVNSLAVEIVVY